MNQVSPGFKARLEYVLNQVCFAAPDGGSHEMRSFVAEKLMAATQAGERSLEGLIQVARHALTTFDKPTAAT